MDVEQFLREHFDFVYFENVGTIYFKPKTEIGELCVIGGPNASITYNKEPWYEWYGGIMTVLENFYNTTITSSDMLNLIDMLSKENPRIR
jgi:hypothetical protein